MPLMLLISQKKKLRHDGFMKIPLNNFRIRLKSFLRGGSWSDPSELSSNVITDFELVRRSRIRQSREGKVIPISGNTQEEEEVISKIKRMRKENNGKIKIYINSHLWGEK